MLNRRSFILAAALGGLTLTACGGEKKEAKPAANNSTASAAASGPWSYDAPGYDGKTVKLDKAPERLVVDAYSTQAMWPYGIRPVGMWGWGQEGEAMKGIDTSKLTIIGKDGEFSLEKLASVKPDLLIGFGNDEATGYTWWDEKVTAQAAKVAPYLAINYGGRLGGQSVDSIIELYRNLAKALGGKVDTPEVEKSKQDYEAAKERVRKIAKERPDISVALTALSDDSVYYAMKNIPGVALLQELGVNTVMPVVKEGAWAEDSWENMPSLKADIILDNIEIDEKAAQNPLYKKTAAAQAGQVYVWNDKRPYTYENYAAWLNQFADQLSGAKNVVD
ncbi:ABC transporter substrate-binding protein [Dermabacteraceae bacterium TAE3-ERU27]|nr:ABC transporter substrate-binding protein [Dermabacteraceae bacterium TAE3-ERU27]